MGMETQEIRLQLNGFGKRLTEIEKLDSKVERNEHDIQKVFEVLQDIPAQNQTMLNTMTEKHQQLLITILFSGVLSLAVATWAIVTK